MPKLNDGWYKLTVSVTDDNDALDTAVIFLLVANVEPVVDISDISIDPGIVPEGQAVTLDAADYMDDPGPGDEHTYRWEVVPDNGQIVAPSDAQTITFTPSDQGMYRITLTVQEVDRVADAPM